MEKSLGSKVNSSEVRSAKHLLNEIASKQGAFVKYDTYQANPGFNPPKFISKCVMTYEVEGSGSSKKKAEQEAAMLLLKDNLKVASSSQMASQAPTDKTVKRNVTPSSHMALQAPAEENSKVVATPSYLMEVNSPTVETDKNDVSETDDFELEEVLNPVDELQKFRQQKKLRELNFRYDGQIDGPLHRKIFGVTCSAETMSGHVVSFAARRYSKKHAKKIAALRVLREVINVQVRCEVGNDRCQGAGGAAGETQIVFRKIPNVKTSKKGAFNLDDVKMGIEAATRQNKPILKTRVKRLIQRCQNDNSKCPELLKDFLHKFAHVEKSKTLDKILEVDCLNELPDKAIVILEDLARETGFQISFSDSSETPGSPYLMVLELTFEVDLGYLAPVTNKKVVHGVGFTEFQAKSNAAKEALDFIRGEPNCFELALSC